WEDPALPDDLTALEALLHLGREQLLHRLGVPEDMRARFLPPPATDPAAGPMS
ncbi:MAG TPA: histidine kinase, partial [Rhodocyclaceae bacterium]|nr:histidine kinase [Rhodocyclaceae bacterium]